MGTDALTTDPERLTLLTGLVLVIIGVLRGWWRTDREFREWKQERDREFEELRRDRDEWKRFALANTSLASRGVKLAEQAVPVITGQTSSGGV